MRIRKSDSAPLTCDSLTPPLGRILEGGKVIQYNIDKNHRIHQEIKMKRQYESCREGNSWMFEDRRDMLVRFGTLM
jgi:hypothetical protein